MFVHGKQTGWLPFRQIRKVHLYQHVLMPFLCVAFLAELLLVSVLFLQQYNHTVRSARSHAVSAVASCAQTYDHIRSQVESQMISLRLRRDTSELIQPAAPAEDTLRSIRFMQELSEMKMASEYIQEIWVADPARGVVYTAEKTRYDARDALMAPVLEALGGEGWLPPVRLPVLSAYPVVLQSCLPYQTQLRDTEGKIRLQVTAFVSSDTLAESLKVLSGLKQLSVSETDGTVILGKPGEARSERKLTLHTEPRTTGIRFAGNETECSVELLSGSSVFSGTAAIAVTSPWKMLATYLFILLVTSALVYLFGLYLINNASAPLRELQQNFEQHNARGEADTETSSLVHNALGKVTEIATAPSMDEAEDGQNVYEAIRNNTISPEMAIRLKNFSWYAVMACSVDEPVHQEEQGAKSIGLYLEILLRYFTRDVLRKEEAAYSFRISDWCAGEAVSFSEEPSPERLREILEGIRRLFATLTPCTLTFTVSSVHQGSGGISEALYEAQEAVKWQIREGNGAIIPYRQDMNRRPHSVLPQAVITQLFSAMENGSQAAHEQMDALEETLTGWDASPDELVFTFYQLVAELVQFCNRKKLPLSHVFKDGGPSPFQYFMTYSTLPHMMGWLREKLTLAQRLLPEVENGGSRVVAQFRRYIDEHYMDRLTPEEVSESLGISYSYLRRILSEEIGASYSGYLTAVRLARAKEMLCETDLPHNVIAIRVGFGSEQTLYRLFKKQEGCSPGEYRQKHRETASPLNE